MRRLGLFALLVLFAACSSSSNHHRARVYQVKRQVVTKCHDGRHVANCTCFKTAKKKPTVIIKSKRR